MTDYKNGFANTYYKFSGEEE
jgi:hypothetical protein